LNDEQACTWDCLPVGSGVIKHIKKLKNKYIYIAKWALKDLLHIEQINPEDGAPDEVVVALFFRCSHFFRFIDVH
jgi:hypothetical protein